MSSIFFIENHVSPDVSQNFSYFFFQTSQPETQQSGSGLGSDSGSDLETFFKVLESELGGPLPKYLQKILVNTGYNHFAVLEDLEDADLCIMEEYEKKINTNFVGFLPGHKKLLIAIGKQIKLKSLQYFCEKYANLKKVNETTLRTTLRTTDKKVRQSEPTGETDQSESENKHKAAITQLIKNWINPDFANQIVESSVNIINSGNFPKHSQ